MDKFCACIICAVAVALSISDIDCIFKSVSFNNKLDVVSLFKEVVAPADMVGEVFFELVML